MSPQVFISHSNADKSVADQVCSIIESRGLLCWIAPRDVPPGHKWAEEITKAIDHSRALVLIFSEHANNSPDIESEVQQAFDNGIPVLPLRIKNVKPSMQLQFFTRSAQWVDAFTPPIEREVNRMADAIYSLLGTLPPETHLDITLPGDRRQRTRMTWGVVGVVACLLIAGISLALWVSRRNPTANSATPSQSSRNVPTSGQAADEQSSTDLRVTDNTGGAYTLQGVYITYADGLGPSREKMGIRLKQGASQFTLPWSKIGKITFTTVTQLKQVGNIPKDIYSYRLEVKLSAGDTINAELVDDWNMVYMGGGGTGILFGQTAVGEVKIRFCDIKSVEVIGKAK